MKLELEGRLLFGLPYQGKLYFDFQVSVLTMGGECEALEVIESLNLDPQSEKARDIQLVNMAYLAQQVAFEGVPSSALTPQFLLENLATDDYLLVQAQIAELRKKRQLALESQLETPPKEPLTV